MSVETLPAGMLAGAKALVSVGGIAPGTTTARVALAGAALLPLEVTKAPAGMVLRYEPAAADVTSTVKVQLPLAGIERPAGNVTEEAPATATGAPTPPQVVTALGAAAITTPAGKLSASGDVSVATATPVLFNVTVSVETPLTLILFGAKALAIVGGPGTGGTNGAQVGTASTDASVVTVPPNANALPDKFANWPRVIPAASRIVPTKVGVGDGAALAPRVVAPTGAQNTSEAQAPAARLTRELAPVVSAPPDDLKM